ncbi:hypothetical protein VTO73DRAFT_9052 [Trametes versicolor]
MVYVASSAFPLLPDDVVLIIIDEADLRMLHVWRRTCKAYYRYVCVRMRKRYVRAMKPYFDDVDALDAVLREYRAVVSGSVALHFFLSDESWVPGDIDIYVPDAVFDAMCERLLTDDALGCHAASRQYLLGRRVERMVDVLDTGMRYAVKDVVRLITRTGRGLDLVRSLRNFLTPDLCVCAHPDATFRRQAILKSPPLYRGDHRAIAKYLSRGFSLSDAGSYRAVGASHADHFCGLDAIVYVMSPLERGRASASAVLNWSSGGWLHFPHGDGGLPQEHAS